MTAGFSAAGPQSSRVMVLGLDAFDPELALRWSEAGELPHLRSLFGRGLVARTRNPAGLVGSVWPTIATGASPARHGRHFKVQIVPGTYETAFFRARDLAVEPFWGALGRAGKRVCVVDVPMFEPLRGLEGIQVSDWATHEAGQEGCRSWPPDFAGELRDGFGRMPLAPCYACGTSEAAVASLFDGLLSSIRTKERAFHHLLDREPWDLFFGVFCESHCVGENCWHLMDPEHPAHDAAAAAALGNPVLDVYRELDRALGGLLERAGPETRVFLLASHTMAANYLSTDLLGRVLRRLEGSRGTAGERAYRRLLRLWRWLPAGLRRGFPGELRRPVKMRLAGAGWSGKRCFEVLNDTAFGAIRINLVGREPEGRVRPGEELEAYCESLRSRLLELVDADTGEPAVEAVHRTRELFDGPRLEALPDLLVEWRRGIPLRGVRSEAVGELHGTGTTIKTGNHTSDTRGLLAAAGPGVAAGRLDRELPSAALAATVGSLLGVAIERAEAEPIPEIVGPPGT